MAIRGSLTEVGLPDVLQLLAMGGKTGCLSVADRSHFGYIFFERGRICYASIVNRRDRLGDVLVKNQVLTPEQLADALQEQARTPHRRLGEILLSRGDISRDQLEQHIRLQIEEAVYFLFTWSQGAFSFEPDQRPEEGSLTVSINPENLLLEGARRVDEWSLFEKKIPSLEMIFALDEKHPLPADLTLTEEQRRLLPLLDGRHTVLEMIDESGLVEFDVGKSLFGLIQAGLVHPVGKRERISATLIPTARLDEHRNLGLAFFKTGMLDEASREFRQVLELSPDHLEARFVVALIELRRGDDRSAAHQFRRLLERAGPRTAALQNLALAFERLGKLENARVATEEALHLAPGDARVLLSHAILLLKQQRLAEAAAAFDRYCSALAPGARPCSAYFAFSVLTEAALGRLDSAVQLGEEGVALYPQCAPLLLHLGAVRERRGDMEVAEALYRRACEEDVTLPQTHKALGDVLYRRTAHDEAEAAYLQAIRLAPELGDDVYAKLGNIRYKAMDRVAALALWRKALQLNPHNAVVRTNLEVVESALQDEPALERGSSGIAAETISAVSAAGASNEPA
jgi:tetratricopeptide (TPR) repeat protein